MHTARGSPIAAREHIKRYASGTQQLTQQDGKGRLSAAAHSKIADADHRPRQVPWLHNTALIERVAQAHTGAEQGRAHNAHPEPSGLAIARSCDASSALRRDRVRAVAPAFSVNVCRA